jgi:hypothetical protein
MSDFEKWWRDNWKRFYDTDYYMLSEKTVAEHAWNAVEEEAEAERDSLKEEKDRQLANLELQIEELRQECDFYQTEWNPGWMNKTNVKRIEELWGLLAELLEVYEDQCAMDSDDGIVTAVRNALAGKKPIKRIENSSLIF